MGGQGMEGAWDESKGGASIVSSPWECGGHATGDATEKATA